jgi:hypothetical protein
MSITIEPVAIYASLVSQIRHVMFDEQTHYAWSWLNYAWSVKLAAYNCLLLEMQIIHLTTCAVCCRHKTCIEYDRSKFNVFDFSTCWILSNSSKFLYLQFYRWVTCLPLHLDWKKKVVFIQIFAVFSSGRNFLQWFNEVNGKWKATGRLAPEMTSPIDSATQIF